MIRTAAVILVAALAVAGCSAGESKLPVETTSKAGTPTTATPSPDPYEVYLKNIPEGEPTLSREDASTRALLGCGQKWPPGTTDAVLAEAYAAYCK